MKICINTVMMYKNRFILLIVIAILSLHAKAGVVDTISTYSKAMRKEIKSVVILPESYADTSQRFPVVYLLHGYSGNYSHWVLIAPQLKELADQYKMIIVCADGGYRSWYIDSPIDSTIKYETYITKELVTDIDTRYRTHTNRWSRAITGLSMGGHGGLYLGIRHKDIFGAAGSMSGGVDLRQYTASWDLKEKILGDTICCKQNWETHSVINVINDLKNGELNMIIDCGVDDFFIGVNRALNQKLLRLKIDHDYIERPGAHNREYWTNSIDYQLLYFHKIFNAHHNN